MNIYYYHPLDLSFKSAQTIQVIKDYCSLSKKRHNIFIYGQYSQISELEEVLKFTKDCSVSLSKYPKSKINRMLSKFFFLVRMLKDKEKKIIITRDLDKAKSMVACRKIMRAKIVHEMHEESFSYLFKRRVTKESVLAIFSKVDAILFTNQSQVIFYEQEFGSQPYCHIVLPNGVEDGKFINVKRKNNHVLTYLGQFNRWKNVELIFSSLALLDDKYTLRVAGGKGVESDRNYINSLMEKYGIIKQRVNFLGFVDNNDITEKVLNESNVLLLPLGDNIQSKYLTSPMKLFEYMSTEIPIVSIDYPSIKSLVGEDIVFLSENNPESFSRAINKAASFIGIDSRVLNMNKKVKKLTYQARSERYNNFIAYLDK